MLPSTSKSANISAIASQPETAYKGHEMATQIRKIDELAETLGDLSVTVDELRDDPDGIDARKLNAIKAALDRATAVVDEIEYAQPRRDS